MMLSGSTTTSIPQRPYAEILAELKTFESYLRTLGLRRAPDRLQSIMTMVKEIEVARTENRLASLNKRRDVAELVWSVVEGQEFADIFRGIRNYDPAVIKKLLQNALKGPLHPGDEIATDGSNIGRNTVFELRLGAALRQAGANITLGRQADIMIDHAGAHIYIECKRPFYERSIRQNVMRARVQLRQRLDADPHQPSVGVVAISVSKAVNPGSNMFVVNDDSDLQSLSQEAERLHKQYSRDHERLLDPRLIGMVYHLFTPALLKKTGLLIAASQVDIFPDNPSIQTMLPVSGDTLRKLFLVAFGHRSESR
jgi:hypothetical protein